MHRLPRFIRTWCIVVLVSIFSCIFSSKAWAIQRESTHFETIMGSDELPDMSANGIHQDKYGLIWVGTNEGLVRYDGNSYKTYKYSSENSDSISSKRITAIAEAKDGTLWISSYDGLNRYNRHQDNFSHFPLHDEDGNSLTPGGTGIAFDSTGRILFGTIAGLAIFDPKTETWDRSFLNKGEFVKGIHHLGGDQFLIAALSGFYRLDTSTETWTLLKESPVNPQGRPIPGRSVFKDSQDRIWMGTIGKGCFVFDAQGNSVDFPVQGKPTTLASLGSVRFITEDFEGNIWIGSNQNGLLALPHNESHLLFFDYGFRNSHSVPAERLQTVAHLSDNQLLFGTANSGVVRIDPHRQDFEYYTRTAPFRNNLLVSPVRFIATGPDGIVWLNDSSRKLSNFNPVTKELRSWTATETPLHKVADNVRSMVIDKHNQMFISTESRGIYVLDLNTKEIEPFTFKAANFKPGNLDLKGVLYVDSQNKLWILGNYILRYDNSSKVMESIGNPAKLTANIFAVRAVHENHDGDLWFGSVGRGLYFYSRKEDEITKFVAPDLNYDLLKDAKVTGIYQQKEDYLWITTQSGIGRLNLQTNQFDNPDYIEPILNTPLFGLECDGQGTLWAVTAKGLIRINVVQQSLQQYFEQDGLFAGDFTAKPIKRIHEDWIALGGQNGMNVFNPKNIGFRPQPPKVTISGVSVQSPIGPDYPFSLEEPAYMASAFTLPCSNNSFTINFASISPGNERGIEYAYRLGGLETDWNYIGNTSHATFTTVKEGAYTFQVKARNLGLPWSEEVSQIGVNVLAPYYLKTWFHVAMAFLAIVLIYTFVRYRTYKIKITNKRLARQVYERTKDLEESRNEAIEARRSAEKADKAKSTFLATVSHEIRTPMNGVLGMSKLLHKTELNSEQKSYIDAINESGSSLLNIINDILDYSKMEAGKFRIHCHDVDIREDLKSIVSLYLPEATSRNLVIDTWIHDDVPQIVSADGHRLRQVVINLLNNAIKFTEKGSISISVSTTPPKNTTELQTLKAHADAASCVEDCDLRLYFSVTDTGIGIVPEDQEKLFQSFSQVEDFEDREFGGTGIGLAISKKLVNLMGGDFRVSSQKDKGSTFTFSIFSRDLDNEVTTSESCCEDTETSNLNEFIGKSEKARILVTDDNEINRIVAEGLIQSLGYQVESSSSGADTLNRVKQTPYDLILMDIQMPGIDGLETTRQIRQEIPKAQQPVIVAMTADSRDEIEKVCKSSGMESVLQKPITEEKLMELFQEHGLAPLPH